jgi:hypothetical protein
MQRGHIYCSTKIITFTDNFVDTNAIFNIMRQSGLTPIIINSKKLILNQIGKLILGIRACFRITTSKIGGCAFVPIYPFLQI